VLKIWLVLVGRADWLLRVRVVSDFRSVGYELYQAGSFPAWGLPQFLL